jgi:hypothetical protein
MSKRTKGITLLLWALWISTAGAGWKSGMFAEAYDETIFQRRENRNTITMAQAFQGLRVYGPAGIKWDTYVKLRYGNDANRDFWNNRFEYMAGSRIRFFTRIYLAFYAEYVRGEYIKQVGDLAAYAPRYEDARAGMIFWHGWDADQTTAGLCFPMSGWSEVYADGNFFNRDRQNFITYVDAKLGLRLLRWAHTTLTPYITTYVNFDTNADFWNNHQDYGFGLRLVPFDDVDIHLNIEYLWGHYTDRPGKYENPYPASYQDLRVGFYFWYGWGD